MASRVRIRRRRITYAEFWAAVCRAPTRALSRSARPSEGEVAYRYRCVLADFLAQGPVYPCWFVDRRGTRFVSYDDRRARAIRVEELAGLKGLLGGRMASWWGPPAAVLFRVDLVVLHCRGCNRRVIIDGVHRVMRLVSAGKLGAVVRVDELSGARWPVGTPDEDVICACSREVRDGSGRGA